MASTTRGSIKISTANEIGTALVDKLGGEGYAPDKWEENINLCGIAEADKEAALSVLSDSAGTGEEKGSILLSTANKIGAMLNKKYYTDRGFKPKEWASAISKTKALTEGTASGTIANIQNGAEKVPITSWVIAIGANLDGINEVECKESGRNFLPLVVDYPNFESEKNSMTCTLLENGKLKFNGTTTASTDFTFYPVATPNAPHLFVKNGTYTFSCIGSDAVKMVVSGSGNNGFSYREIVNTSYTGTVTDETKPFNYIVFRIASGVTLDNVIIEPMLEVGSSASAYAPYTAPTTQAVELGRTIYCGTVDVISGNGIDNGKSVKLSAFSWEYITDEYTYGYFVRSGNITDMTENKNFQATGYINKGNPRNLLSDGEIGVYNNANAIRRPVIRDDSCTTLEAFLEKIANYDFVYESTTENPFTFPPLSPIPETEKIKNYWSEAGASSVGYYEEPTPYTRGTATGAVANFDDARTDLPCTKVVANVAPSIAGKSVVNMYHSGSDTSIFDTYEANLDEALHGGSVDFVSGEVVKDYNELDLSLLTWSGGVVGGNMWCWYCDISGTNPELPENANIFDGLCDEYTPIRFNGISSTADTIAIRSNGVLYVNNGSDTNEPTGHIVYKLATPIESNIAGQVILPKEGVNNFWNDAGGDTEIEYFEEE